MNMVGPHESFNSSGMFFTYCSMNFIVLHSLSSSYVKSVIAVCILIVIFGTVGTFLNTLVLFVFSKSKKMRQKKSYFFIMILSATDLIVVTSIPAVFLTNATLFQMIYGTQSILSERLLLGKAGNSFKFSFTFVIPRVYKMLIIVTVRC